MITRSALLAAGFSDTTEDLYTYRVDGPAQSAAAGKTLYIIRVVFSDDGSINIRASFRLRLAGMMMTDKPALYTVELEHRSDLSDYQIRSFFARQFWCMDCAPFEDEVHY